ncbi:uncharacterized protein LOC130998674 [Salvia miltiorrhiza]|uniref:uncharacterized protein LOC130998674 n=1 Tax=Salvia miltiorrhiza TaxID=226208 RepID=UPI0025AD511E|nr:uncharacterized protein LOC130998674 [Salvia miltiorrhiza]
MSRVDDLGKNFFYNSKEELVLAVGLWNMKQGTDAKVGRLDQGRLYFKCKHSEKCKLKPIKAHSNVVATYVAKRIRDDGEIIKPKSIMAGLINEFDFRIKYDVALSARNLGLEMIYGRFDDLFILLPKYLHALQQANPGTLIDLEVDEKCRFKHLFVALRASISPFYFDLRPVIVVDGTHLKMKNNGILFIVVAKDGNEQVFPLAFGVGPIENDESWKCFLSHVREGCGQPDNLLVVSDVHVSIANAHLLNKIKGYGQAVVELFCQAAYAYEHSEFTRAMSSMAHLNPRAYEKLMRVCLEKWARSQCPVNRYSFLTSNVVESLNARLLWARHLSICSMLEAIRMVLEQWFNDRLVAAQESDELLTLEATQKISAEISKSRCYTTKRTTDRKYRVHAGGRHFMVDLQSEANESVSDYVDTYYKRSSLIDTYSSAVNHLPPLQHWQNPLQIATITVLQNLSWRQAGRPRESRVPSAGERPSQRTTRAEASSSSKKK